MYAFLVYKDILIRSVTSVDKLRTFMMSAKTKTVRARKVRKARKARKAMRRAHAQILLKVTTARVTSALVVISTLDVAVKCGLLRAIFTAEQQLLKLLQ